MMENNMPKNIEFRIETGDVTKVEADVVGLKYTHDFHGADKAVAAALKSHGVDSNLLRCAPGEFKYVKTNGGIGAPFALFVGAPRFRQFGYPQIRDLISQTLVCLRQVAPKVRWFAMTTHGANIGLDPLLAFMTQADICREAASTGVMPEALETITVVELDERRTTQYRQVLMDKWGNLGLSRLPDGIGFSLPVTRSKATWSEHDLAIAQAEIGRTVPQAEQMPSAFVAMPFAPAPHMHDLYELGIVPAVSKVGFRATRIDHETFTGDIVTAIKSQISQSHFVIANLTDNNPNVYLEVGYAWGCNIPTVMLVDDASKLQFDVKSSRCLVYKGGIVDLQKMLTTELQGLLSNGVIQR